MKLHAPLIAISLLVAVRADETPKVFEGLLVQGVPVKGEVGMTLPPKEIDKYLAKVGVAVRKDPKWFREFSRQTKPGLPLPYDERLGLTKEEYAEYVALWNKRQFTPLKDDVTLLLRQSASGTWSITATGDASTISTLRYDAKADLFRSPNGDLKRIEDVNADDSTILGAWSGHEWKFEEDTGLGRIKENIAVGRFAGNKFGLIVYRMLELSTEGTRLIDKSLVVRFPLGKTVAPKTGTQPGTTAPARPAAKTATKPAVKR